MEKESFIPLSTPNLSGNEWNYVKDCLDTGWISSAGSYVEQFENRVAEFTGSTYGIAVMNGTSALQLALMLAGVSAGDYVILPNITFVATANAVRYLGAEPVFIDVDPNTWQMDLELLRSFLDSESAEGDDGERRMRTDGRRISALIPVHVLGNMCDVDKLQEIAEKYSIPIVEDAAESLGSTYKGKHAGTFGKFGCLSFNGNKIVSTGGGGLILTDDKDLALRAQHLSTTAKADSETFFHDEVGYNFRMVNVLAAIGVAQMEQLPHFIRRKQEIIRFYEGALAGVGDICFQKLLPEVKSNGFLFTILSKRRSELIDHLRKKGILSRSLWIPMNRLPMFENYRYIQENDVSNEIQSRSISIPSSTNITEQQLARVVREIEVALD